MNQLIKDFAWGAFVELPTEAHKQMTEWAEVANIRSLFAQPQRPLLFQGYPNAEILINEEQMPCTSKKIKWRCLE